MQSNIFCLSVTSIALISPKVRKSSSSSSSSSSSDEEVVELFRVNKIRGRVFKQLKEEDLKQLGLTALGDRRLLLHLLQQVK